MIALFFDTETTGVPTPEDPDYQPSLVQLGAIMQDLESGRVLAELNLIANLYKDVTIQPKAQEVHGITPEMTVRYGIDPKLIDYVFGQLVKKSDVIVAHNIEYDLSVVRNCLPNTHSVIDFKQHFCTMLNNIYVVQEPLTDKQRAYFGMNNIDPDAPYKVPSLVKTYRHYFDDDFEGAHDAMADIRATRDVLLAGISEGWFDIGTGEIPGVEVIRQTQKLAELIRFEKAKTLNG